MDMDHEGASRVKRSRFPSSEYGSHFIEAVFSPQERAGPKSEKAAFFYLRQSVAVEESQSPNLGFLNAVQTTPYQKFEMVRDTGFEPVTPTVSR